MLLVEVSTRTPWLQNISIPFGGTYLIERITQSSVHVYLRKMAISLLLMLLFTVLRELIVHHDSRVIVPSTATLNHGQIGLQILSFCFEMILEQYPPLSKPF